MMTAQGILFAVVVLLYVAAIFLGGVCAADERNFPQGLAVTLILGLVVTGIACVLFYAGALAMPLAAIKEML